MKQLLAGCVIGLSLILSLNGCDADRYEIKQDHEGRTIRLDKRTGEIAILKKDTLIVVKTPEENKAEAEILLQPKDWGEIPAKQLGDFKVNLITSWRKMLPHYIFFISPAQEELKNVTTKESFMRAYGFKGDVLKPLLVDLEDKYGFKLCSIEIPFKGGGLTRMIDDEGRIARLEANGVFLCSREDYSNVSSWALRWTES